MRVGVCPTPTTDMKRLMNAEDGYCLLYPAETIADPPNFIVINPTNGVGDAWVYIRVDDAQGRTAAQIADEEIAAAGAGFNLQRVEQQVDGEPAIIVDGLPGQDPLRKVFIVHESRLYTLIFMPWAPGADAGQPSPLEGLYTTVMQTIHFLPPTKPLPTPTQPWSAENLPPALAFVYPLDGQVLDYEGNYFFKVTEITDAEGYLWSFTQNGVVVWENLRDEFGLTAGGTYAILAGSDAHSRFVPGPVEVSVQARKGDFLTDPVVITITLQ